MLKSRWLITWVLLASIVMQGFAWARVLPLMPAQQAHHEHMSLADHLSMGPADAHHDHTGTHAPQSHDTLKCHGTSYCCTGLGFTCLTTVNLTPYTGIPPAAYVPMSDLSADQDLPDKPPRS